MHRYLIRRLILYLPTLILASLVIFGIMRFLPGDIALIILSGGGGQESTSFTAEQVENLREQLGLNDALPIQYGKWAWSFLTGDFGGEVLHHQVTSYRVKRVGADGSSSQDVCLCGSIVEPDLDSRVVAVIGVAKHRRAISHDLQD